jgi:phosphomannomutase
LTFAERTTGTDDLDGLTIELADGTWLNVRASNTEPLLRLNVEGPNVEAMSGVRDEALTVIRATNSTTGVPDHAYRA